MPPNLLQASAVMDLRFPSLERQDPGDSARPYPSKIIEAIDYAVPVGVVAYGPESIDSMHRLFAK